MAARHSLSKLAEVHRAAVGPTAHLKPITQPQLRHRAVRVSAASKSDSSWYQQSPSSSSNSSSASAGNSSGSGKQRSRHYYDTTPRRRSRWQQGDDDSSNSVQYSGREDRSQRDEGDEGRGWWEVPREVRAAQQAAAAAAAAAAGADLDLEPWQQERLLLAASGSKKKTQVQNLAADLGLDRSEVLAWIQAFRAKPQQEQAKLLAPLQQQIQQQQRQQQQQQRQTRQQPVGEDTWDADSDSSSSGGRAAASGALPFSAANPNTGFVPFNQRRAAGSSKGKRLPAEVLRTLEGVYGRSPWPSKEVVAGLYDLHRLSRDMVLEWFSARRDMDGLPHNPRQAKLAGISLAAVQQQQQEQEQAGKEAAALPAVQKAAVSRLTAKELASLRAALPSPRKHKGAKLAEELGIKSGKGPGSQPQLEISGITFVARDGAKAWRGAWRQRRAAKGLPARRLDFQQWFL